jgi:hypothetical protein
MVRTFIPAAIAILVCLGSTPASAQLNTRNT